MLSWVTTKSPRTATSSNRPRASGAVAIRRRRSMTWDSRTSDPRRPGFLGDGVEQAVYEAALAFVIESVSDVDIFGNHRSNRYVGAGNQLVGARAEDCAHRAVEPFETPALGEAVCDHRVYFLATSVGAAHDIIEEADLGIVIGRVLDGRAQSVVVELGKQSRQRRAFHLLLVERLDGGKARSGTRTGTGLSHEALAVAAACPARKGSSADATSSAASHGAKCPASGSRTIVRFVTSLSSPSSWTGSSALSCMPQITSVGTS